MQCVKLFKEIVCNSTNYYYGQVSIGGILVTAFFLSFFIGEGLPDIMNGMGKELLHFLPFTLLTIAGFIIAWFQPLWGCWLLMAGAVLMAVYFLSNGDTRMALVYGLPSLLIGLCFLGAVNKELI